MAGLREIVIDCANAAPLAPTVAVDGPGPTLFFQEVPEPKAATKNRLHLDLSAPDHPARRWRAETERLVALGANVYKEYDRHTTLLDPEGNEFCILD